MSFDKHVSSLDELLEMTASYFQKIKFESKIDPRIESHIKVAYCLIIVQIWSFHEDKSKFDGVKITPVSIAHLKQTNFTFQTHGAYLVLLISKATDSNFLFITFQKTILTLRIFPKLFGKQPSLWKICLHADKTLTSRHQQINLMNLITKFTSGMVRSVVVLLDHWH